MMEEIPVLGTTCRTGGVLRKNVLVDVRPGLVYPRHLKVERSGDEAQDKSYTRYRWRIHSSIDKKRRFFCEGAE